MAKYLIIIGLTMLLAGLISIKRQNKPGGARHTDELKDLIFEAQVVREDLEAMLQNVQAASEEAVRNLDQAITTRGEQIQAAAGNQAALPPPPFSPADMRRAHPYIMAPRLRELGYTIVQIAEFLDRSVAEVELILSIADKKQRIS